MKELSCKRVSALVAGEACRGLIIAPTVPRVASLRNPRRDLACNGIDPTMLFSSSPRVSENPRPYSQVHCLSSNGRPATCDNDAHHLRSSLLKTTASS